MSILKILLILLILLIFLKIFSNIYRLVQQILLCYHIELVDVCHGIKEMQVRISAEVILFAINSLLYFYFIRLLK